MVDTVHTRNPLQDLDILPACKGLARPASNRSVSLTRSDAPASTTQSSHIYAQVNQPAPPQPLSSPRTEVIFKPTRKQILQIIARALGIGLPRGAYQGPSFFKLLFVVMAALLGISFPMASAVILSAMGIYGVVEMVKYGRKEWDEQKALFEAKQTRDQRQKQYASIIERVPSPESQAAPASTKPSPKQVLTTAEKIYTYAELTFRSFKDAAKLCLMTLFLGGISYKAGLFAVSPILCFTALGFSTAFAVAAFVEQFITNRRAEKIKQCKAEKKAAAKEAEAILSSDTHKNILNHLTDKEKISPVAVNVRYVKNSSPETGKTTYSPATFDNAHINKARLLLHSFCGFVNGAYLSATLFMLAIAFASVIGFHPVIMLATSLLSGTLFAAKMGSNEVSRQKQEYLAKTKCEFYKNEYQALCKKHGYSEAQFKIDATPAPKPTVTSIADSIGSVASRVRHLGRSFKNVLKASVAAFLIAGTGIMTVGSAAIIPVALFTLFFCGVSLVQFNMTSHTKKRTDQYKKDTKVMKQQIHQLKLAVLNGEKATVPVSPSAEKVELVVVEKSSLEEKIRKTVHDFFDFWETPTKQVASPVIPSDNLVHRPLRLDITS